MSYTGLGRLLGCGNTEFYIKVPEDSNVAEAMRRIHNHVKKMRCNCSTKIIYACNEQGVGMKIIQVNLDEPITKKHKRVLSKEQKELIIQALDM